MSVLSDTEIRKRCLAPIHANQPMISPFTEGVKGDDIISYGLSHAGYDMRMGNKVLLFRSSFDEIMDPKALTKGFKKREEYFKKVFNSLDDLKDGERIIIPPLSYILAYSKERFIIPRNIMGITLGKSTYARTGLIVNCTPAEPGWEGNLTIEIANASQSRSAIYVGEGIAQMLFLLIHGEVGVDYADKGGQYMRQGAEPVPARCS
jgi:dCTP deaminase